MWLKVSRHIGISTLSDRNPYQRALPQNCGIEALSERGFRHENIGFSLSALAFVPNLKFYMAWSVSCALAFPLGDVHMQQMKELDQVDRRTQHKLSEQKRRETIKNSFENLKKVVPDCQNLADQNQQSVLLKAQTYIVDMIDKQHRQKLRADNFECLKSRNRQLEQNITRIQQEYEILSNMD
ncbi:max-like protein X [Anneissia japonica]|uniref:max-like protein X n=1 Tax=Anneissia japonica TaxID=1529436 RepID=UPI001425A236|nr:max-like protein X [Anneissia japonica]